MDYLKSEAGTILPSYRQEMEPGRVEVDLAPSDHRTGNRSLTWNLLKSLPNSKSVSSRTR